MGSGTMYRVLKAVRHPEFRLKSVMNDIALVITVKPIAFTDDVHPICFPSPAMGGNALQGLTATMTGFGTYYYGKWCCFAEASASETWEETFSLFDWHLKQVMFHSSLHVWVYVSIKTRPLFLDIRRSSARQTAGDQSPNSGDGRLFQTPLQDEAFTERIPKHRLIDLCRLSGCGDRCMSGMASVRDQNLITSTHLPLLSFLMTSCNVMFHLLWGNSFHH